MKKSDYLFAIFVALIALIFSVNRSSIWIDEMLTYQVIHESSFSEMFFNIWNAKGANGGMPLYFVLEWGWTQIFGYSEIGLRSLNIPFGIIYFIVSWSIIRKTNAPSWFCLLFFLNPLFIYYMNEARPYILLLSVGSIYTYILFYKNLNEYKILIILYLLFLVGILTHLMFVFAILIYLVRCVYLIRLNELDFKKHLSVLGLFAIPYIAVLYHYMNIIIGAEEIGGVVGLVPNWKASIVQIVYYFTGLGGLGLSRNDLRSMIFANLSWVHVILIISLVSGYLILGLYAIRNKLWKDKNLISILLPGLVVFVGFCVINILFHTRFWERHIIYLLPITLLLLCSILKLMFSSSKIVYKIGVILIVCLTMISGLRTMFDGYYEKEDYKGVANYIKEKDATFLLQGDSLIFTYYGIDMDRPAIQMINNVGSEELKVIASQKNTSLFLILSSRGEFDAEGLYYLSYGTDDVKYNSFRIVEYKP